MSQPARFRAKANIQGERRTGNLMTVRRLGTARHLSLQKTTMRRAGGRGCGSGSAKVSGEIDLARYHS